MGLAWLVIASSMAVGWLGWIQTEKILSQRDRWVVKEALMLRSLEILAPELAEATPTDHRLNPFAMEGSARFLPVAGGKGIPARKKQIEGNQWELHWAVEDPSLGDPSTAETVPEAWPFPAWSARQVVPYDGLSKDCPEYMRARGDFPPIPEADPLPFMAEFSPGLVPLPTKVAWHWGIFANPMAETGDCRIRMRFFLSVDFANPYWREMRLHGGRVDRPVCRVELRNMGSIQIRNESLGVESAWIPLDTLANPTSGQEGIWAWVRSPGQIHSRQQIRVVEPDPHYQPEGLARWVRPRFPVRPGDAISVKHRTSDNPVEVVFTTLGENPLIWASFQAQAKGNPELFFARADSAENPFLRERSLTFRIRDTQFHLEISPSTTPNNGDPRLTLTGEDYVLRSGEILPPEQVWNGNWSTQKGVEPRVMNRQWTGPIFGWPTRLARKIADRSGLPRQPGGPLPGWPDSASNLPWLAALQPFAPAADCLPIPAESDSDVAKRWFRSPILHPANGHAPAWLSHLKELSPPAGFPSKENFGPAEWAQTIAAQNAPSNNALLLKEWVNSGKLAEALAQTGALQAPEAESLQASLIPHMVDSVESTANSRILHFRVLSRKEGLTPKSTSYRLFLQKVDEKWTLLRTQSLGIQSARKIQP